MNNLPMGAFANNLPAFNSISRKGLGGLGASGGFSGRLRSAHARRRIDYHFKYNSHPPKSSQQTKYHLIFNALNFGKIAGEWEVGDRGGMIVAGGYGRPHAPCGSFPIPLPLRAGATPRFP